MLARGECFAADRLEAAKRFAQTMIVVDDEAEFSLGERKEEVPGEVVRPSRRQSRTAPAGPDGAGDAGYLEKPEEVGDKNETHLLDGKALTDSALRQGLVCSVIRPSQGEDIIEGMVRAARRVDIICLDWTIHKDDGETTLSLIREVVEMDQQTDGRLRLIAIYTAEHGRRRILERVKVDVASTLEGMGIVGAGLKIVGGREIQSNIGLKIIYLVKAHGASVPNWLATDRVSEKDLPERALNEFAGLCEGLLSSVALGTVAAIKDAAHQIVGSFSAEMDGPFFHHRALLRNPDEAEDFAIEAVLGGFRSAVRLREVGRTFAGRSAVKRRLEELAAGSDTFRLSFRSGKERNVQKFDFPVADVIRLISDGIDNCYGAINANGKPGKDPAKRFLTTFFQGNVARSRWVMKRFAVLTSVGSHPRTHDVRNGEHIPSLGLGSIIADSPGRYWLCIQASCDSERVIGVQPFLFVPMAASPNEGQHVVPREKKDGSLEYVFLSLEKLAYARGKSIRFAPNKTIERVIAAKRGTPKRLRFKSTSGETFEWVAELRHYQALSVAQKLGQDMGRLGFDEFEAFRT